MELTRALIVALKIIGSNFIFGIILVLVALSGNLNATVLLAFIIIPMATTLVVFFILEEAEDIAIGASLCTCALSPPKIMNTVKMTFSKG